ncbi:MAG: DUF4491 family protein [Anaerolineales bacterium]
MNTLGLITALSTFLGIWLGHVSVRAIERRTVHLWQPILAALTLGLALEVVSLSTANRHLSAAAGILGVTVLWDALEFVRQEKRVKKGHAPANPANPRHARILAEYPSATTLDLLARDPIGRPVSPEEAEALVRR